MTMTLVLTVLAGAVFAVEPVEGFHTDYDKAQKIAQKENKPLYLHFTTNWCGWCRRIENDIYKKPAGKKALSEFVCVTMDCTRGTPNAQANQKLMQKYKGGGYPFLVITTPDGKLLNSFSGYRPMASFKEELKKALEFQGWLDYEAKADKKSLEYNVKALKIYSDTEQWPKAAAAAKALQELDPKSEKSDKLMICFALLMDSQGDEKKQADLEKKIEKLDPKNEKGYLAKVLQGQFSRSFEKARGSKNPAVRQKSLRKALAALKKYNKKIPSSPDTMMVYASMGNVYMFLGEPDNAVDAFTKAIAIEPKHPLAKKIQPLIDKIKAQQAKAKKATGKSEPKTRCEIKRCKPSTQPKDK